MVHDQPSLRQVYVQQGVREKENVLKGFGLSLAWKCCYAAVSGPSSRPEWTTNDSLKLKVSACAESWETVSILFEVGRERGCLFLTYCLTFWLSVKNTWTTPLFQGMCYPYEATYINDLFLIIVWATQDQNSLCDTVLSFSGQGSACTRAQKPVFHWSVPSVWMCVQVWGSLRIQKSPNPNKK